MRPDKTIALLLALDSTDAIPTPPLQAYVFNHQGDMLASVPVDNLKANLPLASTLDGQRLELILGPRPDKDQAPVTATALKRMGAPVQSLRLLAEKPSLTIKISGSLFPKWCLCTVRGRLVKRLNLPTGIHVERPVCHARVHIAEVDRLPLILIRLPDVDIFRLRDDLLQKLRVVPRPLPRPLPLPLPISLASTSAESLKIHRLPEPGISVELAALSMNEQRQVSRLASANSVGKIRASLTELVHLLPQYLCDWPYLWSYFDVDALTTVYADGQGRFHSVIAHNCKDQPDLYFWVEQFQNGVWHTVYRPSIGCGTHWNYVCGTELVFNLPQAAACEEPGYDVPPGVTRFVLPYAIGNTPIWGRPAGLPAAPEGWLRSDGFVDYYTGTSLGWLHNAPFGGNLNIVHDDSYFIPSSGVKYYRYAYRRLGLTANTGADDTSWTPIATPLARGYRMEYSDRLPTYEAYPVGPVTIGTQSHLFEFKPQLPPVRPTDPSSVVVREWTSGNLSEVAASWNTYLAAPPLSSDNTLDQSGDFEIKLEVFDENGNQVLPGVASFQFLARHADNVSTRLASGAEQAGAAYVLQVHVDNNPVQALLPQPSIDGLAASDNCGFLRYETDDAVHVSYTASHPNQHAVFGFAIKRGSNILTAATTLAPYVEVGSMSAPTPGTPYQRLTTVYERDFMPIELVGTCVNAAFAASLAVYGKATDGYQRLGFDSAQWIAFALAEIGPTDEH